MAVQQRHINTGFLLSLSALLLTGCAGDDDPATVGAALNCATGAATINSDPRLVAAGSEAAFIKVARGYLTEMGTAGCATPRASASTNVGFPPAGDNSSAPAAPGSIGGGADATGPAAGESHSSTNVQELGVDEADLAETDGRYFYIAESAASGGIIGPPRIALPVAAVAEGTAPDGSASGDQPIAPFVPTPPTVRIMALDNAAPSAQEIAKITLPDTASAIHGIYLRSSTVDGPGTQLIVVANGIVQDTPELVYGTLVYAYDVATPAAPTLSWTLAVGANHITSRLKDGRLYLVDANYPAYGLIEPLARDTAVLASNAESIRAVTPADLLPRIFLDGAAKDFVQASDCLVPAAANPDLSFFPDLVTVLAIDVADPNNTRGLCTLESSGQVYASTAALYLARGNGAETVVHKIRLTAGGLEYAASGVVPGSVGGSNAQFALSEQGGDLRIVSTEFHYDLPVSPSTGGIGVDSPAAATPDAPATEPASPTVIRALDGPEHRLFVLREDAATQLLNKIAELPSATRPQALGKPGELLHAVRFAGERAYLVTFKKTDPFYVVNLSNPEDPFVAGELLLPGYSDYLQPLGADLVLGVGKDAIDEGDFAWYQGIKIGVFDVSDPAAPKVLGEKLIGKRGSESAALYDHHAVTVLSDTSAATHRIAVPVQVNETPSPYGGSGPSKYYDWTYSGLYLFDVTGSASAQDAAFAENGVIISARATANNAYPAGANVPRSILVGDAVHYAAGNGVWSATWQNPARAVGPQ